MIHYWSMMPLKTQAGTIIDSQFWGTFTIIPERHTMTVWSSTLSAAANSKPKDQTMTRSKLCLLALADLFAVAAGVRADDSTLLDVLVKKGILTRHEAEKLEAGNEAITNPQRQPSQDRR
jgi:hypothetical protein